MVVNSSQLKHANEETTPPANPANLEELLKKNIELSEEILNLSKKVNNFVIWQKILSVLKILIIFIPLILGYYYLLPYFKELQVVYSDLLGLQQSVDSVNNIDLNSISPSLLKNLKK